MSDKPDPKDKKKSSTSSDSDSDDSNEYQKDKPLIFARSKEVYRYTSEIVNPKEHEWWYLWKKNKKKGGSKKDKNEDEEETETDDKKSSDKGANKDGRRTSSLPDLNKTEPNKPADEPIYVVQTSTNAIPTTAKKSILSKKKPHEEEKK